MYYVMLLVFLIAIPSYFAFRRGHNGIIITTILLVAYIITTVMAMFFEAYLMSYVLWWSSWIGSLLYIFIQPGSRKSIYQEINEKYELPDEELNEEVSIEDDDWLALSTFTSHLQQDELNRMIEALKGANIPYQSHSGIIASIMVREADFEQATKIIEADS